jgi:hypothetical protein
MHCKAAALFIVFIFLAARADDSLNDSVSDSSITTVFPQDTSIGQGGQWPDSVVLDDDSAGDTSVRIAAAARPSGAPPARFDSAATAPQPYVQQADTTRAVDFGYVVVINGPARVLQFLAPESPILGLAPAGERLRVIAPRTSWIQVRYGDTVGWIERRNVKPWAESGVTRFVDQLPGLSLGLFAALGAGLLVLIIVIFFCVRIVVHGIQHAQLSKLQEGKKCLIIARTPKRIEYSLADTNRSLEQCFREIGFDMTVARDMPAAHSIVSHYLPDVVCVDWEQNGDIGHAIEQLISDRTSIANALVIFYNVPDVTSVRKRPNIPNAHYIGISITDRDIFKIVTPLIITESKSKTVRTSIKSHALEGHISSGSLSEVVQFIELGSKNGCLLIEQNGPYGMLYFDQARIVYAVSKDRTGREAVADLLSLQSGTFRFLLNKAPASRNTDVSALEILMEWARQKDEAARH